MKKIISSLLAVAMLSASVVSVSAATYTESDEPLASVSSKEELSAKVPTLTISEPVLCETYNDAKTALGATNAKKYFGENSEYVDLYDVYSFTMTVGNLGDFAYGFLEDETVAYATLNLVTVNMNIEGSTATDLVNYNLKSNLTKGSTSSVGIAGQGTYKGYLANIWQAKDNAYPTWSTDAYDNDGIYAYTHDDATLTYTMAYVLNEGEVLKTAATYGIAVDYSVDDGSGDQSFHVENNVTATAIQFGTVADPEPEPEPEPEDPTPATPVITGTTTSTDVTVTDDNKGKVWNGIKIKDVPKGKNYQVKFTDSTVGAAEPSKTFDLNLNGKEVNGDIDFAVVLKTTKNLANITMEILYELVNAQ